MSPEALGAVLGGLATIITAGGGVVWRILVYVRDLSRYHEAREDIMDRRQKLFAQKLAEVAGQAGIIINGEFQAKLNALEREWDLLVQRGKA